jgi:hypothetical protein
MATEELIVLLDAQTQKLDAKLRATEKRLDDFEGKTEKADKSLFNLSDTAKAAGAGLLKVATVVLAVNAAINAMVLASAINRKELELLSKQAKVSTEDFQALAFSTSQFGINAEQIADISKDIADKVGEFSAAGTGAFQDYADVIKLTKEEAQQAAIEFQGLSSQEVLGKMVSEMEKAGATGDQMTFVLESMGNDLSRLQPLFANNSKELLKLKERFKAVNEELQITDSQAEKLKDVSTSYELMTAQLGNAATAISATLAPVMDDFFNDVISVVPAATQTIIDFANSFLDAENITSQSGVLKEIAASQLRLLELNQELLAIEEKRKRTAGRSDEFGIVLSNTKALIEDEKIRTEELNKQLTILKDQKIAIEDAKTLRGGEIGGETGAGVSGGVGTGDQIEAIANRFKDEETLLIEKFDREIELIGENNELKLELEDEFLANIVALDQAAEDEKAKINEEAAKKEDKLLKSKAKTEKKIEDQKLALAGRTAQTLLSQGLSSQEKLFSIVKDSAASQIEAYGLTAGARALAELGPIAGPPVAASYIGWSQVAAGVVRALPLRGGGGGASSPDSGAASSAQQERTQQDFQEETSSLDLTDSSASGSQTLNITVPEGDEIGQAIANWLNQATAEGRN